MNKTFTAAIAITAVAGLASAAIETAPAGYVDMTGTESGGFVANPFDSFTSGNNPTLGDLDGSELSPENSYITVISEAGKKLFTAVYRKSANPVGWYPLDDSAGSGYGDCTNSHPLARGEAIQFASKSGETLTFAGPLNTNGVTIALAKGNNFVGNVLPTPISLGQIVPINFTLNKDYLLLNGVKYAYLAPAKAAQLKMTAGWYLYDDIKSGSTSIDCKNEKVSIAPGVGFRTYAYKAGSITLPGLN